MILYIIVIIDNNYKTKIVIYAIIEDKILGTYRWYSKVKVNLLKYSKMIDIKYKSYYKK